MVVLMGDRGEVEPEARGDEAKDLGDMGSSLRYMRLCSNAGL